MKERDPVHPKYFLAKTDPETYSIEQLKGEGRTAWDGVSNPQAVRTIREMRAGDRVFIYHSGGESAIVGIAEVVSDGRLDPRNPKLAVADFQALVRRSAAFRAALARHQQALLGQRQQRQPKPPRRLARQPEINADADAHQHR